MLIGRIEGATRIMGESQDEYQNLPIRDVATHEGNSMMSAWMPTPDEIERIKNGAPIYLSIYGIRHPPVMLTVGVPPQ